MRTAPIAITALTPILLAACAGLGQPVGPSGATSQTVLGNYEAMASCVAQAGQSATGGPPALRVDKAARKASVYRTTGPATEAEYDIGFTQTGATTVQVEGRASATAKDGGRALAFLWPQVAICATNLTAP